MRACSLGISGKCEDCGLRPETFFCELPRSCLNALDRIKCTMTYPKGIILFREKSPA